MTLESDITIQHPKSMYISRVTSNFYGAEFEIWADFGTNGKGQLISKANCQAVNSSKKQTNEFNFTTTMIPQVDLFSFVFWKKLKTPKKPFKIT